MEKDLLVTLTLKHKKSNDFYSLVSQEIISVELKGERKIWIDFPYNNIVLATAFLRKN
jgi:hypothetical protein